jgi:hypothetical protein
MRAAMMTLVLLTVCVIPAIAQNQPPIDPARLNAASAAFERLRGSACLQTPDCQSFLAETKINPDVISSALASIGNAEQFVADVTNRANAQQTRLMNLTAAIQRESATAETLAQGNMITAIQFLAGHGFGLTANPVAVVATDLKTPANQHDRDNERTILTLFGYFNYDRSVSVKDGPRELHLTFQPLIFASGTNLGNAITDYMNKSAISVSPQLDVDLSSFQVTSVAGPASAVMTPGMPMEWRWRLKEKLLAPQASAMGHIDITLASGSQKQNVQPGLVFDIIGFSWLWPLEWTFDHVIKNWKESIAAVVFFQLLWVGGWKVAWPWLRKKADAEPPAKDTTRTT